MLHKLHGRHAASSAPGGVWEQTGVLVNKRRPVERC